RMIGEHRAGDDAIELAERVASFAAAAEAAASDNGNSSEPAHAALEALATKLGALGFFVDGLLAPGRGSPNLAGEAVEPHRAVEPDPGVGSDADVGSDAEVGSDADVQTGSAV